MPDGGLEVTSGSPWDILRAGRQTVNREADGPRCPTEFRIVRGGRITETTGSGCSIRRSLERLRHR